MAVTFGESFVGGLFGFRRTYGSLARIEADSVGSLKGDWLEALRRIGPWRESRGPKATSISFYFLVPESIADETRSFLGDVLFSPRKTPPELAGLVVEAVVFHPDGSVTLESTFRAS
ncbi:MAG TPA: hypothetical protein VGN57_12835 [Pirellulaceae bacterium]|jgi:hypothetical protein|nr:hypothetical protein [Pirellulaceae bacterium]